MEIISHPIIHYEPVTLVKLVSDNIETRWLVK